MLKGDEILDDFSEGNGLTGTWREWWRGLIGAAVLQIVLYFGTVKIIQYDLYELFSELGFKELARSIDIIIVFVLIFFVILLYLILVKSWKQPFVRIVLLSVVATVLSCFFYLVIGDYFYGTNELTFKGIHNFFTFKGGLNSMILLIHVFLFLIISMFFRAGYRSIGVLLAIILVVLLKVFFI